MGDRLARPALAAAGQLLSAAVGVVLFVLGLGGVRLASAVRRRERAQALEGRAAQRPAEPAAVSPQRAEPVVTRPAATSAAASSTAASSGAPAASGKASSDVALDERPPMQE